MPGSNDELDRLRALVVEAGGHRDFEDAFAKLSEIFDLLAGHFRLCPQERLRMALLRTRQIALELDRREMADVLAELAGQTADFSRRKEPQE